MSENTKCPHTSFDAKVGVARLEDSGRFMAEVRIRCLDCDRPFQFLGLKPGLDLSGATVSLDGLEANIAICPEGTAPNPFQQMMFGQHGGNA